MHIPQVLLTRRMPDIGRAMLRDAGCTVHQLNTDEPTSREELLSAVAGCDALICMLSERIDTVLLDAAGPQLKVVANYAVGYDNIDLAACAERGIVATNTPGVLTDATADLAWALILSAARHVPTGDRLVRAGEWTGWQPLQLLGLELRGATLGIVGAGRIGVATALRSRGFEMDVRYVHPRRCEVLETEIGARRVELDELLTESDIVSLHIPYRPENHHLLNADRLARMKATAVLVNTARGAVFDEAALVKALRAGRPAAAGLDVYEREPQLAPGLADLPNVTVLPHLGSATTATRARMAEVAAENVIAVLSGRSAPNAIST